MDAKKMSMAIVLAVAVVFGLSGAASAGDANWTNAGTSDWHTDTNWNPWPFTSIVTCDSQDLECRIHRSPSVLPAYVSRQVETGYFVPRQLVNQGIAMHQHMGRLGIETINQPLEFVDAHLLSQRRGAANVREEHAQFGFHPSVCPFCEILALVAEQRICLRPSLV